MPVTERTGFREVAKEHLPWLYSLARRLAGDRADDVVQDCLIKAFRSFKDLRDPKAVSGWLRTILVNCARDRFRSEAAGFEETSLEEVPHYSLYRTIAEEDPLPYSDSVHVDFLHSFAPEDVWQVLEKLPPKYRIPLVLVHMEGIPTGEVAEMLDAPTNTVLSWLHRGRKNFEQELWDYAEEHDLLRNRREATR